MARGCDLGFGWLASQPASKPVGHTRHIRHAGHAAITAKVTALRINFSGTLHRKLIERLLQDHRKLADRHLAEMGELWTRHSHEHKG